MFSDKNNQHVAKGKYILLPPNRRLFILLIFFVALALRLALAERPDILFHLAMAYEEKGDKKKAAGNYQRYLDTTKSTDPFREQTKQKLSSLGFRSQM